MTTRTCLAGSSPVALASLARPAALASLTAFAVLAGLPIPAAAEAGDFDGRKVTVAQLQVGVERATLPNGLTLLLAPEPTGSSVAVWMSFRAGAIHEPAGKSGLAHLVEHLMASGPTPATDYATLLETRRARHFNAATGFDVMSFQAVVPAEELATALWVASDRLGTLPALLDDALVARHRKVVEQERAIRVVDAPYGLVSEQLASRLFAEPHPLHAGVGGTLAELASVSGADVREFVGAYLVPANAVLVVAGRFDPAEARRLVEAGLGRLPPGRRAAAPRLPAPASGYVDRRVEPLAREPRVSLAWRLPGLPHDAGLALELGATLLAFMTDGACMTSAACVNPSLTYMPLTARAAAHSAARITRMLRSVCIVMLTAPAPASAGTGSRPCRRPAQRPASARRAWTA